MGNITRTLANNLTSSLGAGGGSGMHTLLNTYNAAGISTDLEMDFPVNGGTYNKFRILIENLYSSGVSRISFKLKNILWDQYSGWQFKKIICLFFRFSMSSTSLSIIIS